MPIGLQLVPDDDALCKLVRSATKCVDICSPFITREGARVVLTPGVPMRIITKVTGANLSTKALDSEALLEIMAHGGLIRSIANLHAKIYICDGRAGVITSSNLTGPGLYRNVEVGIHFRDEPDLLAEVQAVFGAFWEKAMPVDAERLIGFRSSLRKLRFQGGLWTHENPAEPAEPQVEAPAIGYAIQLPVLAPPSGVHTSHLAQVAQSIDTDETGDLLTPLPADAVVLIANLSSSNPVAVQASLHAIGLAAPETMATWTSTLPATDITRLVSDSYPYKSRVVSRLISDGPISLVGTIARILSGDPANESQLLRYFDSLKKRVAATQGSEGRALGSELLRIIQALMHLHRRSVAGRKNYMAPNIDRLLQLVDATGVPTVDLRASLRALSASAGITMPPRGGIPGFQEIRRLRETLGPDFWDGFGVRALEAVDAGQWDDALPSLLALIKELRRVSLKPDAERTMTEVFARTLIHIEQRMLLAQRTVGSMLKVWMDTNRSLLSPVQLTECESIVAALELSVDVEPRWLGSLQSYFGRVVKAQHTSATPRLKKAIDQLSTLGLVRGQLRRGK